MFSIQSWIKEQAESQGLPVVMGILNTTPDSFSDGGLYVDQARMQQHVLQMVADGATMIDVGGESTRPGATPVSLQQELDRVIPIIEWAAQNVAVPVSVDTYKTEVMREAIAAGAKFVNDVNALQQEGAREIVSQTGVSACLMHKQGQSATMQEAPYYEDVLKEVSVFLMEQVELCLLAGMEKSHISIDPGFGFGKTLVHNTQLFEGLECFHQYGYPVLVGVSRKRMIGEILGDIAVEQRMVGSVAAAIVAALKGAQILRVHDVKETVQALKVAMHLV